MLILTGFNDVFMIINYVPGLEVCIVSMLGCHRVTSSETLTFCMEVKLQSQLVILGMSECNYMFTFTGCHRVNWSPHGQLTWTNFDLTSGL